MDKRLTKGERLDNFFIIDHSLRQAGGHHFDYVKCVAEASQELGYRTIIGANQKFRNSNAVRRRPQVSHLEGRSDRAHSAPHLNEFADVRCLFRDTTYQKDSYLAGLQHLKRCKFDMFAVSEAERNPIKKFSDSLRCRLSRRARRKFICRFATDCDRFFAHTAFTPNDHVFFTTVSELELMGLAIYLCNNPKTEIANWHLQFHYNLFDGRTPEYDAQSFREKLVFGCVRSSISRLQNHQLNLYATSDTLAEQFNRLKLVNFERLPYPINSKFAPQARNTIRIHDNVSSSHFAATMGASELQNVRETHQVKAEENYSASNEVDQPFKSEHSFDQPIRLVCPGELRREKGCTGYLQDLVNRLWPDYLATGKVQIVVQRPKRNWPKREKIELTLPGSNAEALGLQHAPIEYMPHPLPEDKYEELIRSTDCGLLFYDSRAYFSRRAGVLGELLACGKPVIVSAGSWLAQQIQRNGLSYLESLNHAHPTSSSSDMSSFRWSTDNVPMAGGLVSFDGDNHPFKFSIDRNQNDGIALVKFDWQWPKSIGVDCEISLEQLDSHGRTVSEKCQIVGRLPETQEALAAFRLDESAVTMNFSLKNAFHNSTASVKNLKVNCLHVGDPSEIPLGSVGVIAAGQDDLFNAVEEITCHLEHYQESAKQFSVPWYNAHAAKRTVSRLLANQQYGIRAA